MSSVCQAPLRRTLPLLLLGVDGLLRGNCHPLSCAPDNPSAMRFGSAPKGTHLY